MLSDQKFIERFEDCSLPNECFHHEDHVKLTWLYLHRYPVLEALGRLTLGLKNFARHNGKPERYHETITWSYFFLIHERIIRAGQQQSWQEFAAANGDLINRRESLSKYYRAETLSSDSARRAFIFPDKTT